MKKLLYLFILVTGIANSQQISQLPFKLSDMRGYELSTFYNSNFNFSIQILLLNNLDNNNYNITFYETNSDAINAINPIVNYTNYSGFNGQTIYSRIATSSGSFYIDSFMLNVLVDGVINFPDPILKNRLLSPTYQMATDFNGDYLNFIDINHDGEIEFSEANAIYSLDLSKTSYLPNIGDFTGINYFQNLTMLNLDGNQNNASSFNPYIFSGMLNLRKLYITYCNTGNILVNNLKNLKDFEFTGNSITNIDLSNLTNLYGLASGNNPLTSLNISNLVNLNSLKCYSNNLTSLDLTPFPNLTFLQCDNNQLNNLNLGQLNLNLLTCSTTNISSLDLSHSTNLTYLICSYNNITNLNFNNNVNLNYIDCSNNLLSTLDFSVNSSLTTLKCNNNNLSKLYIKNGINESITNFQNNPNLLFICVDDSQLSTIQGQVNSLGMTTTVCNSYCSFTPGGNYNTITGSMLFDVNNNGCDASDLPQPNIRVNINDGTNTGAAFTNNTGNYTFYTQAGSFVLTPDTENPTWFTFSPTTATIPFADNNNNTTTQNFCIAANGVHNDVEVVVEPILSARPGFNATYKVVYKNKGNQTLSGAVSFGYDDSVLDFVSATLAPTSQSTGLLNWSYTNLLPFENRSFYITLHVNAPTDTPPVNIGDSLTFTATITPIIADEHPLDNAFTLNQTVVGSFDPNNISCLEGAVVSPSLIGSYLHYGVNFENTGTSQAQNIVVKVVIDTTKYDVNSLQMLNTSNPAYIKITGNVAEFIFQNIMLGTGGHGDVLFKIKTLNSLNAGDMVTKNADIFFDYNAPINTGMANTTFQLLNNGQFVIDNSIVVSPNPTASNVTINGNNNIKSVQVYDVQGRLLETKVMDDLKTTINLSEKTNGIYFLKINSDSGSKVEKIVKE